MHGQYMFDGAVNACRYASGNALSGPDALIQDFYAAECSNAVSVALLAQRGPETDLMYTLCASQGCRLWACLRRYI